MLRRKQDHPGFTLVELLVVVVIIGMLVGIAVPVVNRARGAAQRARCMDYQREIGQAMLHYENQKECFPGYINKVKAKNVSWVVVLFPFLGRNDLYEPYLAGSSTPPVRVNQLACPTDADALANNVDALSYVVNLSVCRDRSTTDPKNRITMSDLKSAGQTPLVAERLKSGPWGNPAPAQLGFTWPTTGMMSTILSSNHSGQIVVTFCDGRVEVLPDDTQCNVYRPGPENK